MIAYPPLPTGYLAVDGWRLYIDCGKRGIVCALVFGSEKVVVGAELPMARLFGPHPPAGVRWYQLREGFASPPRIQAEILLMRRYDATLVWGRDITAGLDIPTPDRPWAKEEFLRLWDYIRDV